MKSYVPFDAQVHLPLDQFTLDVKFSTQSHVTGLFGPSGCGKTSFLEVVCGLRRKSKAKIVLGGRVWQDFDSGIFLAPEKRGIGYVPQAGLLFPHKSVRANLSFGSRRAIRLGKSAEKIWSNVVDLLELGDCLDRDVRTLSGGERQRVALGRALCSAPDLLLLDEPMAALDQPLRRKILPFLRRVREEFEIPMILVSHDPIEVQALCDDLVVLRKGSIFARGTPQYVLMDPAVFPLSGDSGFENVLPCITLSSTADQTVIALGASDSEFRITLPNLKPGARSAKMVGIPSREIMIATTEPKNISARNIFQATIQEINHIGNSDLIQVFLRSDIPPIAVEISHSSVEDLKLIKGLPVYLILKSMGCVLYEESRRATMVQPQTVDLKPTEIWPPGLETNSRPNATLD